jgi:hypothetical protein
MTDANQEQGDAKQDKLKELNAMKVITEELSKLDSHGVARVLRWAADAFNTEASVAPASASTQSGSAAQLDDRKSKYESLADFYAAVAPDQVNDKALVIGYWMQTMQGSGDFDAQSVNKELKNLGHGVANITSAFDSLIARKPQMVIQTKKSGTTRQARKLYRLTIEGQRAVERMLNEHQGEGT